MNYDYPSHRLKTNQVLNLYWLTLTGSFLVNGVRYLFFGFSILLLSACSLMPWHHSTTLNINVQFDKDANDSHATTMLVIQPVEQKDFVTESYDSIAQKSLDKGVQRFVFLKNGKEQNLKLNVDNVPLAVYFILQHQPVSGWKYLIAKPQGNKLSFIVGKDHVTQG